MVVAIFDVMRIAFSILKDRGPAYNKGYSAPQSQSLYGIRIIEAGY